MLKDISTLLFTVASLLGAYFTITALFGLKRPRRPPETDARMKFAVLIPARNEAACISGILESLRAQDYPQERIHTYVIPNNCTDHTALAAKRAGARIINVSGSVKSKGDALREASALLLRSSEQYDAFCVFDADNEADPGFMAAMNRTLSSGARVAKSRILSKNATQSWVCACYDIYFCFANVFLNRARENLGLSARAIGTGLAVRSDYLREIGGFSAQTITEDAEFFVDCAIFGERIAYCEEAITYDEEPLSFQTSLVQRKRWVSGIMQVTKLKLPALARSLSRTGRTLRAADAAMQLFSCYAQALIPFAILLDFTSDPMAFLKSLPVSLAGAFLAGMGNAFLALLLNRRLSRRMAMGIVLYPIFLFSFLPLQTISLFRQTNNWKEIRHSGVRLETDRRAA